MNPDEKSLKFLTKLRSVLEDDALTRKEFVDAFAQVVKIIKELKSANATELRTMNDFLTRMSEKMKSDMSSEMSATEKKMVKDCVSMCEEMMKEHGAKMKEMDEKIMMVQDGIDGKDADEERVIQETLKRIPPPPFLTSVEIRDRLEILGDGEKLSVQAIQDLPKLLKDLEKKMGSKPTGGFNYKSMSFHIIDDETPTGSGTAFTIKNPPNPVSSFKLFRGGARQRITEDYTLSGGTLTLNVALVSGEILLCDYRI